MSTAVEAPARQSRFVMPWDLRLLPLLPLIPLLSPALAPVVGLLIVAIAVRHLGRPEFAALAGFFVVYSPVLFLYEGGPSLVNVYIVAFVVRLLLLRRGRFDLGARNAWLLVLLGVATVVLTQYVSTIEWMVLIPGFIALLGVVSALRDPETPDLRQQFIALFVYSAAAGSVYGLLDDRRIVIGSGAGMDRYLGTQGDPNYMAMVLCVALCYALALRAHAFVFRALLVGTLAFGIAMTASLTGMVCSVVAVALYVGLRSSRQGAGGSWIIALIGAGLLSVLVVYASSQGWLPETISVRVQESLQSFAAGDYTELTSGRDSAQREYVDYFAAAPIIRQLFGGYAVSAMALEGEPFTLIGLAPHNTVLDITFTCGLVGLLVFLALAWLSCRDSAARYRSDGDEVALAFFVGKITWLVFSLSLSTFPSWTYLLLLFVV